MVAALLTFSMSSRCAAQALPDAEFIRENYAKNEYQIPMRDGVRLFTTVYAPKDTSRARPILLNRTPYGVHPYGPDAYIRYPTPFRDRYFRLKYIIVYQDVRGRLMSEGSFLDVRPIRVGKKGPADIDETTDTYDTVEWLLRNVARNNGRVGVSGISYGGFYSSMAAIDAHRAVKAVSPQAPVSRWMGGDDFYHNGAFLLSHAFDFFSRFGWPRPAPTKSAWRPLNRGTPDGYEFFLDMGPLKNANLRYLKDSVAFWNEMTRHWMWDDFWEARDVLPHLRNVRPAMLWVGGWFDTENLWGALNAYAETEKHNAGISNRLVMGPWYHHQWGADSGSALGALVWGSPTAAFYMDSIEVPFFRYYLEGNGEPRPFEAALYQTGKNEWRFLDRWPPREIDTAAVYLASGGNLALQRPLGGPTAFDEFLNDPSKPVPYTDEITHWYNQSFMVGDQRFASRRPDVLTYQSGILTEDLTLAGPVDVRFYVSTSGTDCDWVVKVIDVFPDSTRDPDPNPRRVRLGGYQMMVRGDVMRGKFRNNIAVPEPFVPGNVTPLSFRMQDIFHTFKKGHRLMVQIQSSWFPMVDRNPGKFMNIFDAEESDFQKTVQRVYHSVAYPSHLTVYEPR
jgi:putative CocE/NonD family hydrolase